MGDRDTNDNPAENGTGSPDADLESRRHRLGQAISERRTVEDKTVSDASSGIAGLGQALRLSTEFIAGVVAGGALGWGIDQWFETAPWGMIVFLLLGFAAGVLNVMRSAGVVSEQGAGLRGKSDNEPRN
ncbi:AtpZ/AtpI family protein [Coralliovum pocilloporae]|uniref:AtpZ/AtpI family protein n=1 Tax=Coralliovum pocilloporae TaxID=3066369 RepID=UPI003306A03A